MSVLVPSIWDLKNALGRNQNKRLLGGKERKKKETKTDARQKVGEVIMIMKLEDLSAIASP